MYHLYLFYFSKNNDKDQKDNSTSKRANSGARKNKSQPTDNATSLSSSPSTQKPQKQSKNSKKSIKPVEESFDDLENQNATTPDPLSPDENLQTYHEDIKNTIKYNHTMQDQVKILAEYVINRLGGLVTPDTVENICWQMHQSEKKLKYKSNVIPIGDLEAGTFVHRALLFKVLSDRIGLPVSLVRGNYNRAWNEIVLPDGGVHKSFVVDLMFSTGSLIEGTAAEQYKRL